MEASVYAPAEAALAPAGSPAAPELWNPNAVALWSFLFTPVFGTALALKNYQALGDERGVQQAWGWLIVSLLMLVLTGLFHKVAIPYLIVWYLAWQQKQIHAVKSVWGNSYPRRRWALALLFGLGCFMTLAIIRAVLTDV